MFSSKNKENNVYPCKPQFYYVKVGFKVVKIIKACFRDDIDAQRLEKVLVQFAGNLGPDRHAHRCCLI